MNEWTLAYDKGFEINTHHPSKIAQHMHGRLSQQSHVLDLGCGNGRNAYYFARNGHKVDAIDLVECLSLHEQCEDIRSRVRFFCRSVLELPYPAPRYDAMIAARLIQYLSCDALNALLHDIHTHLSDDGIIGMSFTAQGGIHDQARFEVQTFRHSLSDVTELLHAAGFAVVMNEAGQAEATHVPYKGEAETYDLIAAKIPF